MNVESQKRFLIAHSDASFRETLAERILAIYGKAQIFQSSDGSDAAFKLANAGHHVAFLSSELSKKSAVQLTDWILGNRTLDPMAVVLISAIPDTEHFVEAVLDGRVQFLSDPENPVALERCLMRALNYYFHFDRLKDDFFLKFLASGDALMREGDAADKCYVLKSGRLKATRTIDGTEIVLGHVEPGEFVGEMAYVNGEARVANVYSEGPAELIEIPYERLDAVLFRKPVWAKALIRTLSKRLKVANEHFAKDD